jgi:hypothetical protein
MPRDIVTTVYTYGELSGEAQASARNWWTEIVENDDYAPPVIEDALEVAKCLGIEIRDKRGVPDIYWSGFSSQGDGASFKGMFRSAEGVLTSLLGYAPQDEVLHGIAADLDQAYSLAGEFRCDVTTSGNYCHSYSMDYEFDLDYDRSGTNEADKLVRQALRHFADWIYQQLMDAYFYAISDENVAEILESNEYTFTAKGKRFG